jgi:hypothetical protein
MNTTMTMPEALLTQTAPDPLSQVLDRGVRFVMLRLEGVPGNRKVPGTRVKLGEQELDKETFSDPTARLLTPAWRTKFSTLEGKADKITAEADPRRHSQLKDEADNDEVSKDLNALYIPGVRVVAASRLDGVQQAIHKLDQTELRPLVEALAAEFPAMVQALRAKINDDATWAKMERRIPTPASLRANIALRFTVIPITFLSESGRAVAEGVARSIIGGITKGIETEATRIRERVAKDGAFKDATFNELRKRFQLLHDFSFLASPETLAQLQKAEQAFSGAEVHLALNADLKSGTTAAVTNLNQVLNELTKEVRKDAGGRFRRAIKI